MVEIEVLTGQALHPDASCQAAVNRYAVERLANGLTSCSPATGAYCKVRQCLPLTLIQSLVRQTSRLIAMQALPNRRWQGRAVKLLDGSTVAMPDTDDDQARYPQQSTQKPGLGFPIARVSALRGRLVAGDVLLGDRYYCSHVLMALLRAQGVDAVFQQHQRRITDFRTGQRLGAKDPLVVCEKPKRCPNWLSPEQFEVLPDTQVVREVRVKAKVLVTTMLSAATSDQLQAHGATVGIDQGQNPIMLKQSFHAQRLQLSTATTPVYIVARGGNPGLVGSVDNGVIHMMAALGDCQVAPASVNNSASGNVRVANFGNNTVTVLIGVAVAP